MRKVTGLLAALAVTAIVSCRNTTEGAASDVWGNDVTNAEEVYKQPDVNPSDSAFTLTTYRNEDGSTTRSIVSNGNIMTEYYSLYSPKGNLRLLASGASEMGDVYGVMVDYDDRGAVDRVSVLKTLGEMSGKEESGSLSMETAHDRFVQWMQAPGSIAKSYKVERDSTGAITSVGNIRTRNDYKTTVYVKEWGPFWTSDLDGGRFGIFILQEYEGEKSGSYVNYLYEEDRLIAELAYWRGVLIKVRTYNEYGIMVEQYDDRNIDLYSTTFYDYERESRWWAEK